MQQPQKNLARIHLHYSIKIMPRQGGGLLIYKDDWFARYILKSIEKNIRSYPESYVDFAPNIISVFFPQNLRKIFNRRPNEFDQIEPHRYFPQWRRGVKKIFLGEIDCALHKIIQALTPFSSHVSLTK